MIQSEKQFENKIKKYLKSLGAYFFKHHGNQFSQAGVPDLIVCYKGKFIGIEVKNEIGKPSALQIFNVNQIINAGGYARIVRPQDFESFKIDMEKITYD